MKKIFNYPIEFVTLPEYSKRRGWACEVLRELMDGKEYDNEGEKMYLIQFEDNFLAHAFESELKDA
jgi:hypothetical protein